MVENLFLSFLPLFAAAWICDTQNTLPNMATLILGHSLECFFLAIEAQNLQIWLKATSLSAHVKG